MVTVHFWILHQRHQNCETYSHLFQTTGDDFSIKVKRRDRIRNIIAMLEEPAMSRVTEDQEVSSEGKTEQSKETAAISGENSSRSCLLMADHERAGIKFRRFRLRLQSSEIARNLE